MLTSPPTRGHGGQPTSRSASTLLVSSVEPTDSGKYACRPSNAEAAAVTVHILDGERERKTYVVFKIFAKIMIREHTHKTSAKGVPKKKTNFVNYIMFISKPIGDRGV